MCAGETGRLLSAISRGEFVNPEISQTIFDIMASQQCRNKLPALLPAVASYSGSKSAIPEGQVWWPTRQRPGGHPARRGHLELPDGRRYLIAMFTGDLENDSAGIAAISQVSLAVSGPSGLTAALCALCRPRKGGAPCVLRQNGLYGSIRP